MKQLIALIALLMLPCLAVTSQTVKKANVVCFVKFANESDDDMFVDQPFSYYENLFNGATPGEQTVYNYFKHSSYGLLEWTSVFCPTPVDTKIASYTAKQPRGYYQYKSSINPDGYDKDDATAMAARERALVKEIIAYLDENIGPDALVDADNDGLVDNLTIVLSSCSDLSSRYLLWPHRSDLVSATDEFTIKGKKVVGYLMVFDEVRETITAPTTLGVVCHEMSHSLGTYDLYHVNDNLNPVGVWDLMSDNQDVPQQMTAYTKWRYCKWIDEIPEISTPGTYTLNPVGGAVKENIAYKIKPVGRDEYFVVEYRKKEEYDISIPASGLLVYRVNPSLSGGNVGYNGTTRLDEQYIFRPGGTTTADGAITQAVFSQESGRTAFGGLADQKPFYSDGTTANFAIANVSACGETLSFDLLEMTKQLILSEETLVLKGQANSAASLTVACDDAWTISGIPSWLTVTPTEGAAGTITVSIMANADNDTGAERQAELTIASKEDATLAKTVTIIQQVASANIVFADNFENTDNPNGWTIENTGEAGRGWQYTQGSTTGKGKNMVNSGIYAMTMVETFFEDIHQEARLTSPSFAGGKMLTFYSHANGSNATPKEPPLYLVEVSSDGGTTWTRLFNVLGDYPRNEDGTTVSALNYTEITLDLSAYMSDNMKIRFNCYDTNDEGLQYWWQIDDLEIVGSTDAVLSVVERRPAVVNAVYDLQGRRVAALNGKGIYLVDGRKIVK